MNHSNDETTGSELNRNTMQSFGVRLLSSKARRLYAFPSNMNLTISKTK